MQTIVAYRYPSPQPLERILEGVNRVATHYSSLSKVPLKLVGSLGEQAGLFALVPTRPASNWPMWSETPQEMIATAYVPIGWRRLLGDIPLQDGPRQLHDMLRREPERVAEVAPPFALFALDKSSGMISVINDGLGYSRIYESNTEDATIFSSRADAPALFVGVPPQQSDEGWKTLAGCGWFMGDTTPYRGVQHLAPGSQVFLGSGINNIRRRQHDAIGDWVSSGESDPLRASQSVASELHNYAVEVASLWDTPPTVHLSGGRDSRATAAAFVSAESPARFHTVASLQGELDVATELLAKVGRAEDHNIVREKDTSTSGNIVERALSLQLAYGAIYGPAGSKASKFTGFGSTYPVVTGAAGEIARGNFYKGNFLKRIREEGLQGPRDRLQKLYAFHGAVHDTVSGAVNSHIERALEQANVHGVTDVSTLDYFYLVERLRRWSNASCKLGTLTPLASPYYIRGAFAQSPESKLDEHYHLNIIQALVPEWADVPFYKARPEDARARTRPWLWDSGDRAFAEAVINEPSAWDEYFIPREVDVIWGEALTGKGGSRHEMLIQRLIWVYAFKLTLQELRDKALGAGSFSIQASEPDFHGFVDISAQYSPQR